MKHLILTSIFTLTISLTATCKTLNINDFGAVGDGVTDDAAAIQAAIDSCAAAGGGTVVVPSGKTFVCGPLRLASDIDFRVEKGAVLLALPDEDAYTASAFRGNRGEGMMWICGENLANLRLSGEGVIDGNGVFFMGGELEDSYELKPVSTFDPRPHILTLINVNNLKINDLTFANSAYWTVHLVGCEGAAIENVTIRNNVKIRNSDGIDLDHSRNVVISGCRIESGDDCICLKNRREYDEFGPCANISVANCAMTSRSCAFKIGSENVDKIENVAVSNCVITGSNRGIGIQNRDEGEVRNVVFKDITIAGRLFSDVWWGKAEPIYVTSFPRAAADNKDGNWRFPKGAAEGRCGEVSGIVFENIAATSENGVFISGDTLGKVRNITLRNVEINIEKTTDYPAGIYDRRPCDGDEFAVCATTAALVDTACDIVFEGFKATIEGQPVIAETAIVQRACEGITIK